MSGAASGASWAGREVDLATWPRRSIFEFFRHGENPHLTLCSMIEVTQALAHCRERGRSFFHAVVYAATRAANAIPELRTRIRGDQVVLHDRVHPSFTVPSEDPPGLFNFATVEDSERFEELSARARAATQAVAKRRELVLDPPGRDDLIFMTCIPWVAFTHISHPMVGHPAEDSFPRIAWGKYVESAPGRWGMPLSIQVHHALADGLHCGRFINETERVLAGIVGWAPGPRAQV